MTDSLSPAKIIDLIQNLLNETAAAQNYELESKTVSAYEFLQRTGRQLPSDESGLSSYYRLFCAWIRWLCDWDHYALNLTHRRRLIGYLNKFIGEGNFRLQIYPYAARLYGIENKRGFRELRIHEALDYMNDTECRQTARAIASSRWNDLKQTVRRYQERTPQYSELVRYFREIKAAGDAVNDTEGSFYDLERVFQECNKHCFGGKMPRPEGLRWSQRVNHATMGSYNVSSDTVMINRGLDRRDVPSYVLDFVMYHELLHKALGIKTEKNRNRAHTAEFRKLEQAHPYYQQAQDFIRKNSSRL